ncbi:beta-lactamase class A [Mariprofundus ferrinatatus]|uniref:beta-lactamase n=1 Tax=Mariprofundus ferrinatatus TaxID=1921087 RepID=A0A2K8L4Z0_9PROT|nr:serine hydrolase [Mariprofundus ferrinatatus]ATX82303.1 beta-lactamase class A [Mariprofundus ferrinatatus]
MRTKLLMIFCSGLMLLMPGIAFSSDTSAPSIRQQHDPALQQRLNRCIKQLKLTSAVQQKRLSVALVDVTDPSDPSMAQINGDEMMYAASLPKIAILLAAFERIAEGKLQLNDNTRETMTSMIRHSSNSAATAMIRKVGGNYINTVLSSPKYRLYDPRHNGGLWVGKEYAKGSAFHRDPLHQLSHGATAIQVARFYYMLETGRLVSPEYSQEMKAIMSKPGINHKFVKGLSASYPDIEMYRKSGSWGSFHADSALIEHNGRHYIAVALANDPKGGEWMTRLIREMDDIIFKHAGFASADAAAPQMVSASAHTTTNGLM